MAKKYFIITDSDLDGICSYITLSWFLSGKPDIPYKQTTVSKFRADMTEWLKTDKFSNYDKVFILDMDISDAANLVDYPNVVVIDHHKTHVPNVPKYTKAKCIVKEYTSATKLIYSQFKQVRQLTKEQTVLVALADDYDCYALKVPQSYDLHIVYQQTQNSTERTKSEKFIDSFGAGFKGFTEQQSNIVRLHRATVKKIIDGLVVYGGEMQIQGDIVQVRSTLAERAINEVADHLLRNLQADVAIVVNPVSQHVSFRRTSKADVKVDVSKMAESLCEGGGHEYAAGGKITQEFMNFTTLLRPINS
jgi:oligoribonuclease NrnB/cAMP/cGMP phosphodiesterase (DHH superfamily)